MWHNVNGVDLGLEKYGFLYRNKLYWVERFVYIDNARLIVRVEGYVDLVFLYYGNYLRGQGTIKIQEAPLFLEDKNLCYSFCQDLGNVKLLETRGDWQPSYKCMYFDLTAINSGRFSQMEIGAGTEEDNLRIPIDLQPNSAG